MKLEPISLSVTEAAKFIGVSRRTVCREIKEGKLPAVRIAGRRRVLVRIDDLKAYLDNQPKGR